MQTNIPASNSAMASARGIDITGNAPSFWSSRNVSAPSENACMRNAHIVEKLGAENVDMIAAKINMAATAHRRPTMQMRAVNTA
jgi:hypothetical protein